jgi:hypothetical protein
MISMARAMAAAPSGRSMRLSEVCDSDRRLILSGQPTMMKLPAMVLAAAPS